MKKINFEKKQGTIALGGVIVAFLALAYSIYSSRVSISDNEKQYYDSQRHQKSADSIARIERQRDLMSSAKADIERQKNFNIQDSTQKSMLKNLQDQSRIFAGQLETQSEGLKYSLKANEPKIDIANFEKTDSLDGNQNFKVTFINTGYRACKLDRVAFAIVNNELGYDTTFLNSLNDQVLNYRTNSTIKYFAPASVVNDPSTKYYFEATAIDNLTDSIIDSKRYFKKPVMTNGQFGMEALTDWEYTLVQNYVNVSFYMSRDRLKKKSLNDEKYVRTTVFNRENNDLKTILVSNIKHPCKAGPGTGCWKDSVSAIEGDTVSVQIYFHNCGNFTARAVVLQLTKDNSFGKVHLIKGLIDEDNGILRGTAKITSITNTYLKYIPKSMRYFKEQGNIGYGVNSETSIFTNAGLKIGNIKPGWNGQGVVVADFKVLGKEKLKKRVAR